MRRVLVLGSGGAGKSTLARQLGAILGIEVIHLDAHYWKAGWVEPPKVEWADTVAALVKRDAWVMDGNYSGTLPTRFALADTVVFLDVPRTRCLSRVLKRRFHYHGQSRPDMAADCPEKVDWGFLKWVWNYPSRSRPAVLKLIDGSVEEKRAHVPRSPREVRSFLTAVEEEHAHGHAARSARTP